MEWLVRLPFAGDNAKLTYHRTYEEEPREEGEPHPLGGFGSPNEGMKRYSMTLVHNCQRCSLVAYLLDGDSLPSAALKLTPPSPCKKGFPSIASTCKFSVNRETSETVFLCDGAH